ncbi:hypothetical protein RJ639_024607 [Escallonia herrerae]|uniref:Uncharacterized protein n=1 Tax=Escallonia herrerae TaxID=1293975 RepID=A0AA88V0K9_9ASTE|nr:hypothetical protein RJ639_024607 [Escallonia herrerae]
MRTLPCAVSWKSARAEHPKTGGCIFDNRRFVLPLGLGIKSSTGMVKLTSYSDYALIQVQTSVLFYAFEERIVTIDEKKMIKETNTSKGGYVDMGFNLYRIHYDVIPKSKYSCITRVTLEYDLKEGLISNAQYIAYVLTILKPIVDEAADEAIKQTAMKQKQSKSVITQIHELQMIMNLIISEDHSLDESFQVSTIISKLPLAWKECRKELKQKKDAMTMQEWVKYIQVEENSRNLDRLELEDNKSSKALVIDHGSLSGSKRYAQHSKAYRFLTMESMESVSQNIILESRDAEFFENSFSRNRKSEDTVDEDQVHPTPKWGKEVN